MLAPKQEGNRVPASVIEDENCIGLISGLINPKTILFREGLDKFSLTPKYRKRYMEILQDADLKQDEIDVFFNGLSTLPNSNQKVLLLDEFFAFNATLFPKSRKKLLELSSHLFDGSYKTHQGFKKFLNRQKKFTSFQKKAFEKEVSKAKKEFPNASEEQIKRVARKAAKENTDHFKRLYRGCYTKGMTQEHKAGGKAFTYFTISIAAISSGAFYTYSNYEDPEFLTSEFFKKMSYEMVGDGLWAALASWIFKDPEGGFLAKSVKMYLADNVLIMADGLTWEQLFAEGEQDAVKRIEELKRSPEFKEDMGELVKLLEREKFMDKVSQKFGELLVQLKLSEPDEFGIDWEGVTKEDLEKPEVREALMKAALMEMYEDESGDLSLGTYGADRWGFYSGIGIPFMFLDTLVTTKIYHTMCMAPLNPKAAILKASLIFTAYSIFYDTIAYPMRKKLIGE
ncbi:MAG: hypothetical protein CME70_13480 [Halobacteriovorax sp.]|nr:hypothetical protein [Halobacteriovorax sp.]|tara:strand:+ start:27071 stop:28435 length:1365 start_codon:yes stop_codon:yes gene_type:complete